MTLVQAGRRGFVRRLNLRLASPYGPFASQGDLNVRHVERSARQRIRPASRAWGAERRRRARGDARGARCLARGRRRAAGRSRFRRQGHRAGRRPGSAALGHSGPDGRQDRPRRPRRDARRGDVRAEPRGHASGGDHDGRPAGLGQNDHDRQARQAPDRKRAQEGPDGLARRRPTRGAGAACGARPADERRHAADRRRPAAGRYRQARDPVGEAPGIRRGPARHRGTPPRRRPADGGDEGGGGGIAARRKLCSSSTR